MIAFLHSLNQNTKKKLEQHEYDTILILFLGAMQIFQACKTRIIWYRLFYTSSSRHFSYSHTHDRHKRQENCTFAYTLSRALITIFTPTREKNIEFTSFTLPIEFIWKCKKKLNERHLNRVYLQPALVWHAGDFRSIDKLHFYKSVLGNMQHRSVMMTRAG